MPIHPELLDIYSSFNPNDPGSDSSLFGLPYTLDHAELVILPIPWEVTVSYRAGTADGPEAIQAASAQVDLYIRGIRESWKFPMVMLPVSQQIKHENNKYRDMARTYLRWIEEQGMDTMSEEMKIIPRFVNDGCEKLHIYVKNKSLELLKMGKQVALLGGDHSTPLGLLRALATRYKSFGILQIDAHADLRVSYENFVYSHASIMYNALKLPQVKKLVQVGIRDICEDEVSYINNNRHRITTFYDESIKEAVFQGSTWQQQVERIIEELPELIYISFDIDGLAPAYCPNTGTPVPGGLTFEEATYLIRSVVKAGKTIIGFDLNEVAPGDSEWDENVGARLLYQLACWMGVSQGKIEATIS